MRKGTTVNVSTGRMIQQNLRIFAVVVFAAFVKMNSKPKSMD